MNKIAQSLERDYPLSGPERHSSIVRDANERRGGKQRSLASRESPARKKLPPSYANPSIAGKKGTSREKMLKRAEQIDLIAKNQEQRVSSANEMNYLSRTCTIF